MSRYPESGTGAAKPVDRPARRRRASVLGVCIVALVIALIVILHLSGVIDPSGH